MGLFDDLGASVSRGLNDLDTGSILMAGVNSYFEAQRASTTPLTVVGPVPTGNLTQAQLANGMLPVQAPIAGTSQYASMLSNPTALIPILALVGVGAYFIFKKR